MSHSLLSRYSKDSSFRNEQTSNLMDIQSVATGKSNTTTSTGSGSYVVHITGTLNIVDEPVLKNMFEEIAVEPYEDGSQFSVAERCNNTMTRIVDSMDNGPIRITPEIAISKEIWTFSQSEENLIHFPLSNVGAKCSILNTLVCLLQDYNNPQNRIALEKVAKVLQSLNELIQTSNLEDIPANSVNNKYRSSPSSAQSLLNQQPSIRKNYKANNSNIGNDTRSVKSLNTQHSNTMSLNSWRPKSNILGKLLSRTRTKRNNGGAHPIESNNPNAAGRQNGNFRPNDDKNGLSQNRPNLKNQDLESMDEYRRLIISLKQELAKLPHTQHNDIIFSFMNKTTCPFILRDCTLLLQSYIENVVLAQI